METLFRVLRLILNVNKHEGCKWTNGEKRSLFWGGTNLFLSQIFEVLSKEEFLLFFSIPS